MLDSNGGGLSRLFLVWKAIEGTHPSRNGSLDDAQIVPMEIAHVQNGIRVAIRSRLESQKGP